MPPHTIVWRRLYDLRAEHLSSGARASSGGAQCSCVVTGEMRRGVKRRLREPVSGLTHLVGGLLALIALIVLLTKAAGGVDQSWHSASSVSASSRCTGRAPFTIFCLLSAATARLRRLDHMTIFILIAGTYTPIACSRWTVAGGLDAGSDQDAGIVRRRAQASVDGRPALALGGDLSGNGVARRDRRLRNLPGVPPDLSSTAPEP